MDAVRSGSSRSLSQHVHNNLPAIRVSGRLEGEEEN
jgi:hypothetical protein